MKKYIIIAPDERFHVILHANPGAVDCKYQWYISDEPNNINSEKLSKQIHESFIIGERDVKQKLNNKWVYCHCKSLHYEYDTEYVYLSDNVLDIISKNAFTDISFYNEQGNIRSDVSYVSNDNKECSKLNYRSLLAFIVEMKGCQQFYLMRWSIKEPFWYVFAGDEKMNIGGHYCLHPEANIHEVLGYLSEKNVKCTIINDYFQDA